MEPKPWYRIANTAGVARVDIYDEIGGGGLYSEGVSAAGFVADLAKLKGALEVHINSPGGNVFDGITIYNAISQRPGPVTTVVDGLAASAASFIAQAGKERIVAPGAMVMIHDAHGLAIGNAQDLRGTADLLDKASDNIADLYAAHSGRPAAEWREAMRGERWYKAQEAVDAGLADRVAERPPDEATLQVAAATAVRVWAKVPDWVRDAAQALDCSPDHGPLTGTHTHIHPAHGGPDDNGDGMHHHPHTHNEDNDHSHHSETEWAGGNLTKKKLRALIRQELAHIRAEKYSAEDRRRMAGNGHAMPDGSYPIEDEEDLHNAIHAVGRGGSSHNAIRRHIIKRAKALGKSGAIPDSWNADGSTGGTSDHAAMPAWLNQALTAKEAAGR